MEPLHGLTLAYLAFFLFLLSGRFTREVVEQLPVAKPAEGEAPVVVTRRRRRLPESAPAYFFCLWIVLSIISKLLLEHEWMSSSMHMGARDWIWTVATALSGISVVALISGRFMVPALWFANGLVSLLFWIDILYLRYFDDVPGAYMLNGLGQAPAASGSAWRLRETHDLWLFTDLLLPFLWLIFTSRAVRRQTFFPRLVALQWLMALTVYHCISIYRLDDDERRLFRLRFRNMAIVEEIGLLNYHAYDILQMMQSRWVNLVDRSYDKELVERVVRDSRQSMSQKTPYLAKFKGKNLLVIQLESLEAFVIDLKVEGQEIMPVLNQLKKECLWGALQDQTGQGRSSDGEFVYNNSLLPPGERPLVYAYPSNHYFGIPAVLNEVGYYTLYAVPYWGSFWNCRFMSERYGFRHHMLREDFAPAEDGETIGWGLTDKAIFKRVIPHLLTLPQPFYCYAVTMMGHHPYAEIPHDEEPIHLSEKFASTMLRDYLNCCRFRDSQLSAILAQLKESGLWDNTVIVFVGDHDARIPDDEMALLEQKGLGAPGPDGAWRYDKIDKLLHDQVTCLIHCPGNSPSGHLPKDAVQVDLIPTLIHLLGAQDVPSCFFGRNMLATKRPVLSRISKGGYALDAKDAVTDEGSDFTAYSLADHQEIPGEASPLKDETRRWFKMVYDFLRLDLVPTMRETKL